jgi:hypothetical protein
VSLDDALVAGEVLEGGGVSVMEESGRKLLRVSLVGGGEVAVALAKTSTSSAYRAVRVAAVGAGGALGATTLAGGGGGGGGGAAAAAGGGGARCFVATVAAGGGGGSGSVALSLVELLADGSVDADVNAGGSATETSGDSGASAPLDASLHGSVATAFPHAMVRSDGRGVGFRVVAATTAASVALLQPGKQPWLRDEALSNVLDVAFVSKSASELYGHASASAASASSSSSSSASASASSSSLIPSFEERLQQQKNELMAAVNSLFSSFGGGSSESAAASAEVVGRDGQSAFTRHKFGLDKVRRSELIFTTS